MPTKERIEAALTELSEKIVDLGDDVIDIIGPQEHPSEGNPEEFRYYILAEDEGSRYYFILSTGYDYGSIFYPFRISNHIARQLSSDEIESIIDESIDWNEIDERTTAEYREKAGEHILINTPVEDIWMAKFHLSMYASTALVRYSVETTEDQIPLAFQCIRNVYPITENVTLRDIGERIESVLNAGERGKRYVEASFRVDKTGEPADFTLKPQF